MKTILIGINAKFIHTNLAIRYLKAYAENHYGIQMELAEFTINQRPEFILQEIYKLSPDLIGFSCYIWNFEMIRRLTAELKLLLPHTRIFLGGPEVSYNAEEVLRTTKADIVTIGEGEQLCAELVRCLEDEGDLSSLPNLAYWDAGQVQITAPGSLIPMEELPFVYQDLSDLEHKILYYESSRGCPFQCQYCLSCRDGKVRFLPLDMVYTHLEFFLKQRVRQVKFVDRTFNCNKSYAMSVWKYLAEHDNGYTNFHFEIAAELLDEEMLSFLATVRKGYFQFEIGVQSTNPQTLEHIRRNTEIEKLRIITASLREGKNIHLHLDLIIGLPYENYERFGESFNDVFALRPDQLQVGFLKLLKGSGLYDNRERYGIVASGYAPYEVLYTAHLPYTDLLRLKMLEEMVEVYYNSNRFLQAVGYLCSLFPSPFCMFEALAEYYEGQGYHLCSHSNSEYYTILYGFFQSLGRGDQNRFKWCCKFDYCSHEKPKKLPDWLDVDLSQPYKTNIYSFFDHEENLTRFLPEYMGMETKQIYRQAHVELFPAHPDSGMEEPTAILFNYKNCDLLGNAEYLQIPLFALERNE